MGILDSLFGKKQSPPTAKTTSQQIVPPTATRTGNVKTERIYMNTDVFDRLLKRYIAFDVETTGLSAYGDRIVELGAVLIENGQVVNKFSSLINPGVPISEAASRVNHITNAMLKTAPREEQVYPAFIQFLGDALKGETIICAHNADFDMGFLSNTLKRLGYDGKISYIATLYLSRSCLKLPNHKQDTVANHFGIVNEASHRAVTDAQTCGQILWKLMQLYEADIEEQKKRLESRRPSEEELEVCALIHRSVNRHGGDTKYLSFERNSSGYVVARCQYNFVQFKFAKKGKYIIVPAKAQTPLALQTEVCTVSEGGMANKRLYFGSPFNLEFLDNFFWSAFQEAYTSMKEYIRVTNDESEIRRQLRECTVLTAGEAASILEKATSKNYEAIPEPVKVKTVIPRSEVSVHAVNNRCPLVQTRNLGNSSRGFDEGYPLWEQAEALRKAGDITGAIDLYDKARFAGYDAPALYNSYAMAYRKLKDYDNEIEILEEYIQRQNGQYCEEIITRRDRAVELLYEKQKADQAAAEKAAKKADKQLQESEDDAPGPSSNAKPILQMNDDGEILREYESVKQAAREIGISPKSIRDAANGVQKHAGGYVWKFKA